SDEMALKALFSDWRNKLRAERKGIEIIPLQSKSKFLLKFGRLAAEKLVSNTCDVVVGLPDLYPLLDSGPPIFHHSNLAELQQIQSNAVRKALLNVFHKTEDYVINNLDRLHASALKYDLEMLLLAAEPHLAQSLKKTGSLGTWRHPVENQNNSRPPKR